MIVVTEIPKTEEELEKEIWEQTAEEFGRLGLLSAESEEE